ncbi:MAG: MBL fold metallo-hydrolase [Gemmataceae bacterium]|nr:MBL fold metallo-hydrolase [Gemmataceae bacterium]
MSPVAAASPPSLSPAASAGCAHTIAEDVAWVPLSIVNVYLVGPVGTGSGGWVLVDAGMSFSANTIRRAVRERFAAHARPAAIVLTHAHFDHVGSLVALAEEWDVPVYAHRLELPYLTGRASYPPPDPTVGGGMMAYLCRGYDRGPVDLGRRVRPLPDDGAVPAMPGWRWVPTPGHAPGHVSFFRDRDRCLIAGDAFVTTKQESMVSALTGRPRGVRRPPAYFTQDWEAAKASVRRLAALQPEVAATGHGFPMSGPELRRELNLLAAHFDRVVPSVGRYVSTPATFDENGPRRVPPPLGEPIVGLVAAVGAGALLGWLAGRR